MSAAFVAKSIKHRFVALMIREKYVDWRITFGRAENATMRKSARELIALRWAIDQLGRLYPTDRAEAERDVARWRPPDAPRPGAARRAVEAATPGGRDR